MELYIGADVHAASVSFSVLSATGKQVRRDVVETHGQALVGYLKQLPGTLHLCIEEGEWSPWLYEILSPHVAELVVYRGEWKPGVKSDAIDAHGLAEKLRTGTVGRPVFKDARRFTALRAKARAYTMLTRDVARVKSRLKSFYRARGVPCAGEAVYKPVERTKRARELPLAVRQAVDLLGRELDALVALKAEAEREMVREALQLTTASGALPGHGRLRGVAQAPRRGCGAAAAEEAPAGARPGNRCYPASVADPASKLEARALKLPPEERARLAERLIASLDREGEADAEALWIQEAERRLEEIESGAVGTVSAGEVIEKARSSLR